MKVIRTVIARHHPVTTGNRRPVRDSPAQVAPGYVSGSHSKVTDLLRRHAREKSHVDHAGGLDRPHLRRSRRGRDGQPALENHGPYHFHPSAIGWLDGAAAQYVRRRNGETVTLQT
jgi:hypothetical protein